MKSPHLLLAGSNCLKLRMNLVNLLDAQALASIDREITANVVGLFRLAEEHYRFAKSLGQANWRHEISRYYYAAYNFSRSLRFFKDGRYSTDSSDHKNIELLPDDFTLRNTFLNQLSLLRDDRNLCDYDHTALVTDLVLGRAETERLLDAFHRATSSYLLDRGVSL